MDAVLSDCGRYRYRLTRGAGRLLAFVMLNPSTADATVDDPTIRRCVGFAKRDGYDGITVMNLYAYRATKPADLANTTDPEGPNNLNWLESLAEEHATIVCAWGANADPRHARSITSLLERYGARLVCLGQTANGSPRHPLYVKGDTALQAFTA